MLVTTVCIRLSRSARNREFIDMLRPPMLNPKPPIGGLRRLVPSRVCLVVVPLALVWGVNAFAAESDGGGGSSASGSGSGGDASAGGGSSAGTDSGFYDDDRPVVTNDSGFQPFQPSGAGTNNPLGFASGFSPGGCAPALDFSNNAISSNASVLEQADGPRRKGGRYIQASVGGSETFSDNINLDPDNEAESDFVTVVAPRIDACSSTGRIRGELRYTLQGVVYANNSSYDDIYNDVEGRTRLNLIQDHLYLDANTRYGQSVIDPSVGYSRSNIIRPNDNKTAAWRTNISPYALQSLGLLGQGMLRYRYGRSVYGDSDVPDTTVHGVVATITSPDVVEPLSWQAQAISQTVDSSGGNENQFYDQYREIFGYDVVPADYGNANETRHFDSATLQLGYHLSRTLQLTALGGIEDDYKDNGQNDRWSSPRWQVGVRWNSGQNTLQADYGHRFYGSSYSLYIQHRSRLVDFSLSYEEEPSTGGLDSLNGSAGGYTFGSVGSIDSQFGGYGGYGGYGGANNGTSSLFDRDIYVRKRWQARMNFDTALTRTNITSYSEKRDYQSGDRPGATYRGIQIDTRYAVARRTSIVPSARWEHQDDSTLFTTGVDGTATRRDTESDNYEAGVSVVRAISPTAQAAVGYQHDWRNDDEGFDYTENRITLQFRKAF
ncbi:TIGR03016 family PEP-CTERM system-associated outer membrane protein [Salinisphaera sp. SPP-AMP-43]|uniref:TIGR03016 family PEP-CTERM system-associated outer membrane protein n=1 Tax=Salinisphaera sp. SPP-AMP-43 TaxID=3121288 RepID=UPI003C6E7E63